MKIKYVLYFVFLLLLTFGQSAANFRNGLWVVRHVLQEDRGPEEIVVTAKRLKINDLYVQVRALGQLFFTSEKKLNLLPKNQAYHSFKKLIKLAHRNHIRVHAWLNILYISDLGSKPNKKMALNEHPYILHSVHDSTYLRMKTLKHAGIEGFFTDPLDEQNSKRIERDIRFLIDSLAVDGIHLDYLRYPSLSFSFSNAGRTAYILKNYYDPVSIYTKENKNGEMLAAYRSFLNDNITRTLKNIRLWSLGTELSIAVKPNLENAPREYIQNWPEWINQGLCDAVILMNYSPNRDDFLKNLHLAARLKTKTKILIGIASYNIDSKSILSRIKQSRETDFAGMVLFSYNDLILKKKLLRKLQQ